MDEGGAGGGAYGGTYVACTFSGNVAFQSDCSTDDGRGGGAMLATLVDCSLLQNRATRGGGASDCTVSGGLVDGNRAEIAGGGLYRGSALASVVRFNRAVGLDCWGPPFEGRGGGLNRVAAESCVIHDNQAQSGGGAADGCSLERCTLWGNSASVQGGGVFEEHFTSSLRNSIVWSNTPQELASIGGSLNANYSDIGGGWPGTGNLASDPRVWDALAFDFHLKPNSICIDAGDPSSALDPDGTRADMGALPFDPNWCPVPVVFCTAKTNSQGCVPAIGFSGTARLSGPDDFVIRATNVINRQSGLVLWSRNATALPFQGGTKCVAQPSIRGPLMNSAGNPPPDDCSGVYSFAFTHAYMAANGVVAGDTLFAQCWYRDPASLPFSTGLTDALRLSICP